jgi:hypothetical protein
VVKRPYNNLNIVTSCANEYLKDNDQAFCKNRKGWRENLVYFFGVSLTKGV